ncbi:MAG: PfkB family carbohydrate kinase, partial [Treponema sp.]|nr:PfkB family carbohydrate kinase [Treponema sp.]
PKALYCCDPVMGDVDRGIYVKQDIPAIFRDELIPLADIVTPNEFELETLTDIDIREIDDARRAIDMLHVRGPGIVLVTSYRGGNQGLLGMLASDRSGLYIVQTPELPITTGVAGAGDLTASVFLSRYLETGDIKKALELCVASIFGILEASWKAFCREHIREHTRGPKLMELRIIQAQNELDNPSRFFEAHRI